MASAKGPSTDPDRRDRDVDLVAELEAGGDTLSAQVNEAVRVELGRRRQQRLLATMLDELGTVHGPADEKLVQKYADLLG